MSASGEIRIGISGWRYKGWRGEFYPAGLAQRRELEFASQSFNSIELNGTFYSLQRPESFAGWYDETPLDFVFSVKGSRYITHMLRLANVQTPLATFFAQGILRLKDKLGPVLWQLPPNFKYDRARLENFFSILPRSHKQAAKLAKGHDQRLDGRAWTRVLKDRPLRHAIEIRHETFACAEFIDLLRKHDIGLVVADTVEWPLLLDLTSDFVYCRLHGSEQLYVSGYTPEAIEVWAGRVVHWAQGREAEDGRKAASAPARTLPARDVYVYFDNDAKVRAPFDAQHLQNRIAEFQQKTTMSESPRDVAVKL